MKPNARVLKPRKCIFNDSYLGKKIAFLTVIKRIENNKYGQAVVLSRCECGRVKGTIFSKMLAGHVTSCGCMRNVRSNHVKHDMSLTPEYNIWAGMIQRCTNPNSKYFSCYGGRGITVCEQWRNSFETFFADMGPRPQDKSIDRINNDKGYGPENCRWATEKQQAENTRRSVKIEIDGITKNITEWCRIYKTNSASVRYRMRKDGITRKEALLFYRSNLE